jgi:hypothetical protein
VTDRRPRTDEHARHVDSYHGIPIIQGHFERRMATVNTGIVEQNVDTTVSKRYLGESPFNCLGIPHVSDDRLPGGSDFIDNLRRGCFMGVNNHNTRSGCSEGKSDSSADAAAATGYDRYLVLQQKVRKWKGHHFLSAVVSKRTRFISSPTVASRSPRRA